MKFTLPLRDLYLRAIQVSGPKAAIRTAATAVEGYWLEEDLFFFVREVESTDGHLLRIPAIANAATGKTTDVISIEALGQLLSTISINAANRGALDFAEFDMPERHVLAVSVLGQDYLIDVRERRLVEARASSDAPTLRSPDGRYACQLRDNSLWLVEGSTGRERRVAADTADYRYAQSPETAMSAVASRRCPTPVGLWSPDSQWFLTHRIYERDLPESALIQHVPPGGGRPIAHRFKYSLPGDDLPEAVFVAIHAPTGRACVFDDFPSETTFSPFFMRTAWFGSRDTAWFVRFDRYCRHVDLIRLNLTAGSARLVMSESVTSGYIDLHPIIAGTPNVRVLSGSDEIIWFSEKDGWGHLYLHDSNTGSLKNRITAGKWMVRDIVHVDEKNRKVLFLANGIDPAADRAQRSLCSSNLDGSDFEVLLDCDGDVSIAKAEPAGSGHYRFRRPCYASAGVSPEGRRAVVRLASVERGNVTRIVELGDCRRGLDIASSSPRQGEPAARRFTALAADGATRLHGVMFLPPNFDEDGRYPLIDYIYPGPHVAHQPQVFGGVSSALARSLAELGFVTIMIDSRGMPVGSKSFHQVGYGALLEPQLADHAAVVRQLRSRFKFVDGDRVGVIGLSAGGSAAVRVLCDYSDVFKVAVAACANNEPTLCPAFWADKYIGPEGAQQRPEEANSTVAHRLQGKLLLIAGDMDENVQLNHPLSLVNALIQANKDFDLLIVPNAGHMVLTENGYALRRAWDHLVRHLLDEAPPGNVEIRFEAAELARFAARSMSEPRE